MAMQMQSLFVRPVANFTNGSRVTRTTCSFGLGKRVGLRVKCMAEEGGQNEPKLGSPPLSEPTPVVSSTPTPTPKPTPKPQPKVSTKFGDVFAFSGPAPERINGRLAMFGFVAAMAMELTNGTDLFGQISNGGGQWFVGTSILLSIASLVPMFKGKSAEEKTDGLMNSNAEIWNGRLAMLGLIALAFTEFLKGGALI